MRLVRKITILIYEVVFFLSVYATFRLYFVNVFFGF
ncbi:hypothetical protein DZA65_02786 [Dickeya dianthicola]|nr:hypothetical protein DZA65_02786 [Dickeya dianthicola]